MKTLHFYIGLIGSGKTHYAHKFLALQTEPVEHIEVSTVMRGFAPPNATREQLQNIKLQLAANPRFLIDELIRLIEASASNRIVISGLRELWIYKELVAKYNLGSTIIVESDRELRRKRRNLTPEEFEQAERRDNAIGISELIAYVKPKAWTVYNNFEQTTTFIRK